MSRNKGFTVVEVLVVIAIIGIIVALLIPAFKMAADASKNANKVNVGEVIQAEADDVEITAGGDEWVELGTSIKYQRFTIDGREYDIFTQRNGGLEVVPIE